MQARTMTKQPALRLQRHAITMTMAKGPVLPASSSARSGLTEHEHEHEPEGAEKRFPDMKDLDHVLGQAVASSHGDDQHARPHTVVAAAQPSSSSMTLSQPSQAHNAATFSNTLGGLNSDSQPLTTALSSAGTVGSGQTSQSQTSSSLLEDDWSAMFDNQNPLQPSLQAQAQVAATSSVSPPMVGSSAASARAQANSEGPTTSASSAATDSSAQPPNLPPRRPTEPPVPTTLNTSTPVPLQVSAAVSSTDPSVLPDTSRDAEIAARLARGEEIEIESTQRSSNIGPPPGTEQSASSTASTAAAPPRHPSLRRSSAANGAPHRALVEQLAVSDPIPEGYWPRSRATYGQPLLNADRLLVVARGQQCHKCEYFSGLSYDESLEHTLVRSLAE
ncbi:hypothetical protein IE81DRAFT_215070 [Ceraceosorus guamensis]|uniref:Uncharacterized protein n=1 Tax=Ceraceosorus guamensis TaxID=1522189 RepID=A0A316VTC7_9BASI|nr:hypothetical protein IE81DRAFT_215070 [Ceraceosorus guamensis]PWN40640.1 hypothetical protein IE81DRAFT_215070 [Ceraceosorus guamensis]